MLVFVVFFCFQLLTGLRFLKNSLSVCVWHLTEVVWGRLQVLEDRWEVSAISRFNQLHLVQEVEKLMETVVLGKHKRNLERQLGSGSYTSFVYIFTWKLSRRRCNQPRPLLTCPHIQVGAGCLWPAFLARAFSSHLNWGRVTLEMTGVLVIRSWHSRVCFHTSSKGSQFAKSLLPVCTVFFTEKQN